eukprot:355299-Chlamydomonas_euryale.AAC.6
MSGSVRRRRPEIDGEKLRVKKAGTTRTARGGGGRGGRSCGGGGVEEEACALNCMAIGPMRPTANALCIVCAACVCGGQLQLWVRAAGRATQRFRGSDVRAFVYRLLMDVPRSLSHCGCDARTGV